MKILIVEDDANKLGALCSVISDTFGEATIATAHSLIGGVKKTQEILPEIIVLDMTLPTYDLTATDDGGIMEPFGGVEFLRQLRRFSIKSDVLIVTQFETFGEGKSLKTRKQLSEDIASEFSDTFRGIVHYHASLEEWTQSLISEIEALISGVENQ